MMLLTTVCRLRRTAEWRGVMNLFYPATAPTLRRRRHLHLPTVLTILFAALSLWMILRIRNLRVQRHEEKLVEIFAPNKVKKAEAPAATAPVVSTPEADPLPEPVRVPFREYDSSQGVIPASARAEFDRGLITLRQALSYGGDGLELFVRHPDITKQRIRAFDVDRHPVLATPWQIGPKFGLTERLLLTTIHLADGTNRHIVLERTPNGHLLDWESFAGWCELKFEDINQLPSRSPALMRVNVQPSNTRPPFTLETGASFTLSHPMEKFTLSAHATDAVLKASKVAERLRKAVPGPFTVRISADATSLRGGWVRITEVVCAGWVTDL